MKVLILVAALLGLGACAGAADLHGAAVRSRVARQADVEANLNNYFDSLVENIRTWASEKGLDPLALPELSKGFDFKGLIVEWHGELSLTNGVLKDISTLERRGDIIADYSEKHLKVSAVIGFGDLQFTFDYLAQFMDIKYDGIAEGLVDDLKLYVDIDVDLESLKVSLESFNIEQTGDLHIEIHGNGVLDLLPNAIADVITSLFKDQLMDFIEGEIKNVLEDTIANIDLGSIL